MYPWQYFGNIPEDFIDKETGKPTKSGAMIYSVVSSDLLQIACSRFDWETEDGNNSKIERILLCGSAVLRKADNILYPLQPNYKLNMWGEPIEGYAILPNGTQKKVSVNKGDVFYFGKDVYRLIIDYAIRITKLMQTLDVNLVTSRVQYAFAAHADQIEDVKRIASSLASGDDIAVLKSGISSKSVEQSLTTGAQLITGDLLTARRNLVSCFAESIGIHIQGIEKKERLVVDEVSAGEDVACMIYSAELDKRKELAEIAGWKVKARYTYAGGEEKEEKKEGAENEQ